MNLDFEARFKRVIQHMEDSGNLYAEAKGQSWQAQELKGSVLASLMRQMENIPVSAREQMAKGHEDYKKYVQETAKAIQKELELKCEYEKWKASFEALRSLSSLEKKTMEMTE